MSYSKRLYELQDELWAEFEKLVRNGADLPLTMIHYPDGKENFDAIAIVKDEKYNLKKKMGILTGVNKVTFIDSFDRKHTIEPDLTDIFFIADLLDSANPKK